jgi:hypothetical protein
MSTIDDTLRIPVDIAAVRYGLSTLNTFCTLHINLTLKEQARGDDDRRKVKTPKELVCLFVCFPGVTTHCGCIFHSPVAGFSLLVFEVS